MTKTEELLAVLDLPEDEQWNWLTHANRVCEFSPNTEIFIQDPNQYFADLAFRLRDEVGCENYHKGLEAVYNHYNQNYPKKYISFYAFCTSQLKPIGMIIAALIAKELAGEEKKNGA